MGSAFRDNIGCNCYCFCQKVLEDYEINLEVCDGIAHKDEFIKDWNGKIDKQIQKLESLKMPEGANGYTGI